MTPEHRSSLLNARAGDYHGIVRTTSMIFLAVAAMIHFGPGGYSAPLSALVVFAAAYGILAGSVSLTDIDNLRADIDETVGATNYGQGAKARNVGALKMISAVLIALVALAELYALWV